MSSERPAIILPSAEDLIHLHDAMLRRFGGAPHLRDRGLLESEVGRVERAVDYVGLDLVGAAVMLCWTIVKNHPWVDGNKRAGYGALVTTLAANGWRLDPSLSDDEIADRIIEVAASEANHVPFHDWVQTRVCADNTYRVLFERDSTLEDELPEPQ